MKDSELGLPPGALGRAIAESIGRPPEIFADVPQLVTLVTLNEGTRPTGIDERVAQLEHLTALGRIAASSSSTRALILYAPDRVLPAEDFLAMTENRSQPPRTELMVWVSVNNVRGELSTQGLAAIDLPEAHVSLGPNATSAQIAYGRDVLLSLGNAMINQFGRVADGFKIGSDWTTRFDGEKMRVVPIVEKKPLWKRLF